MIRKFRDTTQSWLPKPFLEHIDQSPSPLKMPRDNICQKTAPVTRQTESSVATTLNSLTSPGEPRHPSRLVLGRHKPELLQHFNASPLFDVGSYVLFQDVMSMFPQRFCFPVPAYDSTCVKDQVKGLSGQWYAR
ncbi:hypothetical protein CSAL01_01446 [Colletotrichum salicis]|uniref:Uncharacterized protein n=1 Tax=Colletotrichum salicis TaxID=1209931 RepID=A0A135V8N7_9PEZI|nr:hypothetical protein CSAL01_01446 [Colletotrichum salicis]